MIVIIDYNLGNLASVVNALNKLKIPCQISSSPTVIKKAKGLILPGVGAAGQGMRNLKQKNLDKIIIEQAKKGKPILGICLGMQLFLSFSEEGNVKCLGLIKGRVKKLPISSSEVCACTPRTVEEATMKELANIKIPQIGWNKVTMKQWNNETMENYKKNVRKLFKGIPNKSYFYFVNSYYCQPEDKSVTLATTNYGIEFCSVLKKDNIIGVQFHPEKSGKAGLRLLKNFTNHVIARSLNDPSLSLRGRALSRPKQSQ